MNPIKTSELYQNTGELKELIKELELVQFALTELKNQQIKDAKILQATVKKASANTSAQREQLEESSKQADEITKRYKKYNDSLGENAKKIAALKNAQQTLNQVNKNEAKLLASKEGSYNALSAQYSLNKIRLNQMSEAERKNTKAGKELVKVTNEIFQEMKSLQAETGKTSLNVGNYQEAIEQADRASGGFIGSIRATGKAFKALLLNPVGLFLAAIVGTLAVLGNAFKSSDKGARLLEKGTALVSAGFSVLVDLSVQVVEGIETAFGAVSESKVGSFAGALVDKVLVALKGIINTVGFVGEAFSNLIDGEFKKATESAVNAGKSIGQAFSGIELTSDSKLVKGLENVIDKVVETGKAFTDLQLATLKTQRANRELTKSVESLTTQEALLRATADDTTKSFKEREDAAEKARAALEAKSAKEIEIARNNLTLINTEIDLNRSKKKDVEGLLDAQLSAFQALKQAEREYTLAVRDNERTRDELKQDRLERDLDILLDIFDNQKTINEKLIADDELTFEKRKQILDETNKLNDSSFAKQIETIQKFTGIAINANELIGESDAIILNQKIRNLGLSEIIEGRLIEIIRDRKSANQDLADSEKDLNKAIAKRQEEQLKFRTDLIAKAKKAYADFQTARKEGSETAFEQRQELAQSEFDLLESTEDEKTRFALQAEKERIQKIIEINKQFGGDLTDVQIETFLNQIKKIDQEIGKIGNKEVKDIYDLFGFKLGDEQKQAIATGLSFVKDQFGSLLDTREKLADQAVSAANTEVEEAQRTLQAQQDLLLAGEVNTAQAAQRQLEQAKRNQEKALKERQKAQKAQNLLDTAQQTGSLITASANIFKAFSPLPGGSFLAAAAIATMFGTFIASKVKANKLVKKSFGKGTYEVLKGGSHLSGDDIGLGMMDERTERRAEGGEGMAIFAKKRVSQYRNTLPTVVKAINSGTFEEMFMRKNMIGENVSSFVMSGGSGGSVDMKRSERLLEKIGENTSGKSFVNGHGNLVETRKNKTTEYV